MSPVFARRTEYAGAWVAVSLAWCLGRSWSDLNYLLWLAGHFLLEKVAQVALVLDCTRHVLGAVQRERFIVDMFHRDVGSLVQILASVWHLSGLQLLLGMHLTTR